MKKMLVSITLWCFASIAIAQHHESTKGINIIPIPVSVQEGMGSFTLLPTATIGYTPTAAVKEIAQQMQQKIARATGFSLAKSKGLSNATIQLQILTKRDTVLGNEGYRLQVTPTAVIIKANEPAGLFYGVQSLWQLLPAAIESKTVVNKMNWKIPEVAILDYPRFVWRGLMFDVARHFFTKQQVENYIDEMAKYKFNILHLHLTDDEGWRIEIKGLPRLTEIGAWNVKKVGYFGTFTPPKPDDPRNYGGFYTQDDIKEMVAYAQKKFVNILPEIDVPGHSLSAIVSYPDLSCTPGANTYHVRSGEEIMDWSHGAPPIALIDNTLCPANPKVYTFLDTVFTQVAKLFPFPYIHVGGDECPKNFWEISPAIHQLMQKEGLKTMEEVQSYFEKRIEKIVESKGKKFMGWDEILEGGLAPNAVVMSWRGMKGGIEAAKMKHRVVMSPTTFAYLDYMQGDSIIEPRVYATLRLNKAYSFEPVPDSVDSKYILGGQANLWTEQVYNTRHLQYMTWPRAFAVSETVWSPKANKNWLDFVNRVEHQFKRLDIEQVKYAPSMYDPIFTATKNAEGGLQIELATEVPNLQIHYSFDNSFPDQFYPVYSTPLTPPEDAVMLKVITYRGNKVMGRMIAMPIKELKKRAGIQ
ncbi:MAG: beta-N-acetylhexosaminidase [Hydrotalea sp. AMD]|uniref:beta-N-acetylhexosaminidase n=1 Tax=Hydrotalea sp. AMD TaxID=2501297 RepID=UPI000944934B|nr:family 20 glycosylhydrolase [Hydrotalea sp. AMD]RWZ87641.1 MAG: beta-N-acetylhexosaminidase [Hydrotalea sp. AMD]